MLALRYQTVAAGAPDTYAAAADLLLGPDGQVVQRFPKSADIAPAADPALANTLDAWLAGRPAPDAPVYVMVHGYQYNPEDPEGGGDDSPFGSVYGFPPTVISHLSWLPLVGECDDNGLSRQESAIGFAYDSRPTTLEAQLAGWNHTYQHAVFDYAPLAARALATVLAHLGRHRMPVRILAHSLGTRTTSQALRLLHGHIPTNLQRILFLNGAEFCVDAATWVLGQGPEVINIVNRRDKVLDWGGESACHPLRGNNTLEARVIGRDGLCDHPAWLDLQMDRAGLAQWCASGQAPTGRRYAIRADGLDGAHAFETLLHWNCYTFDGNRALMRDLLMDDRMTVAALRNAGIPGGTDAPAHGHFLGQVVPDVPRSRRERQALFDAAMFGSGGSG